jgi:hypothetical protein
MPRVERPAIEPDIGTVTARLDEALRGIVTTLAQTLKWAAPEFVAVAMMRLNVIADSRRLHNAGLRAILAQRMFEPGRSRCFPFVDSSKNCDSC